ncbi:MAG TPA: hypothetical protein VHS54_13160 [Jatrophihabitans sp.]|nr:hypothetical protein [Jatrophihabitans sp.]
MDADDATPCPSDPRFWLSASRVSLLGSELLGDERLLALAVDDALWTFRMQDWAARQPPTWRRLANRRWFAEGNRIFAERERLRSLAVTQGLRDGRSTV